MIHDATAGNPSIINYTMFVAVISMLSLIYLFLVAFNEAFTIHPVLPVAVDLFNTLFFFCGAVALAAKLGVHSCGNQVGREFGLQRPLTDSAQGYIKSNAVVNGAANQKKRCHEAQASDAFLWFGFASYAASLLFSLLAMRGGGMSGPSFRKGGPAMSQV
jgi:hypothetical protein